MAGVKIAWKAAEYKDKHPLDTRMPKNKSGCNSTRFIMRHSYLKAYTKARRTRGFTIIETVATLFTLVVGILPMVSLLLASRVLGQQAQMQAAAYSLGRQEMATLLSPSYGSRLAVSQASFAIPSTLTSQFPNAAFTGDYTLNTYSPAGQVPAEQQIIVRVCWTNPASQGTTSSIELDTISAQGAGR